MDEAIDEAFEAVIREDIEANERKQHRKSEGWLAGTTPVYSLYMYKQYVHNTIIHIYMYMYF